MVWCDKFAVFIIIDQNPYTFLLQSPVWCQSQHCDIYFYVRGKPRESACLLLNWMVKSLKQPGQSFTILLISKDQHILHLYSFQEYAYNVKQETHRDVVCQKTRNWYLFFIWSCIC